MRFLVNISANGVYSAGLVITRVKYHSSLRIGLRNAPPTSRRRQGIRFDCIVQLIGSLVESQAQLQCNTKKNNGVKSAEGDFTRYLSSSVTFIVEMDLIFVI